MIKIKKILNYIYIILGAFFVTYLIYIRFFFVRLPKDLHFNALDNTYTLKMTLLLLSIVICIYLIIKNIKEIFNIENKQNAITKIFFFFSQIIEESLKRFFAFILSFYHDPYELLSNLSRKFYDYAYKYPEYYLLFFTYFVRMIILLIFLVEIFLTFKFQIFYKSLILLSLVLLVKFLIFVLKDFAQNLSTHQDVLIIEDKGVDEKTQLQTIIYTLKPEYKGNDINYVVREYVLCNKLLGFLHMYNLYAAFFNPRINFVIYSLYLLGWLYILFFNIFLII